MPERSTSYILLSLLILGFFQLRSTHLVGGEITYECLGNDQYEVTMVIYRDCITNGAPFDNPAIVTVYDQSNNIVLNQGIPLVSQQPLALEAPNNCTTPPGNVCTEKGIYKATFTLPPIPGGYTISHQRCCRNPTITNINNINLEWGSTYTTSIPSMDNCNSSPKFQDDPPVVLCINEEVTLDLSASDNDGDSLHYELCSVLHGGSNLQGQIAPDPALPPPYVNVPFDPGFSSTYPIASAPAFAIHPSTGVLEGKPTQVGQFVFAICVSEYKNGEKLSTTRRDFQFNVSAACIAVESEIGAQALIPSNVCSGGPIQFSNASTNAGSFWWDFGDTTTLADTSISRNPTYVYPDTGRYYVTLIAEPDKDCADTTILLFEVFEEVNVDFIHRGEYCLENNSIRFIPNGDYSEHAIFEWDFGGAVVSGDRTAESPTGVAYAESGRYYVTVTVSDFNCTATFGDTVVVTKEPLIAEEVPISEGCAPYTVTFTDQSDAEGKMQHYWIFGDGSISSKPNPTHTYEIPGTYTVEHVMKTLEGCLDSGYSRYQNAITVYPVPYSGLEITPAVQSIYDPNFKIESYSEGHNYTKTILPGGEVVDNLTEMNLNLPDSGVYVISHISGNGHGCADTLVDTIEVITPFNLFVPKAFTPDGDGINDIFYFSVTDVSEVVFEVYNRWGQVVFASNSLDAEWNGKMNNTGKELPPGIYSYVLIAKVKDGGYEHKKRGIIHLMR